MVWRASPGNQHRSGHCSQCSGCLIILFLATVSTNAGLGRTTVTPAESGASSYNLDGTWEFEVDPDGVGKEGRWFDVKAKPTFARTLVSPGPWEPQHIGNETDLMYHQFQGVGWYRRSVDLVELGWAAAGDNATPVDRADGSAVHRVGNADASSVWLWIGGAPGGVVRAADVWANGVYLGRHVGYLDPVSAHARTWSPCPYVALAHRSRGW